MMLTKFQCFCACIEYIRNDSLLDPDTWEVGDLLSMINMPDFLFDSDSPTMDPAYWDDWKEVASEFTLAVPKDKENLEGIVNLEQGLKSIQIFLREKYWKKNNSMLLIDAYSDLIGEYERSKENIFESNLWKEWLAAVKEGLKFDKTFKEPKA